jgi:transposase
MAKVVSRPEPGQAVFIGLDVSRSKWVFNVRWGGAEQRRMTTAAELRHLEALVAEYHGAALHLAYEACGFGYEIAWMLRARGVAVTVVPPSTVERAPGATVKTDRLDARALAGQLEQGRLKHVHVPTRDDHAWRQLSRTYDQALKDKKRAQARIRALLQGHGRLGPLPAAGWPAYERWLSEQELPAPVQRCLAELLALRAAALASTQRLKRALTDVARDARYAPVVTALATQSGVGSFTAVRLRLELGDITHFRTADAFANYLGLTPSEYSSGDRVQRGSIVKRGPGHIRGWFIQCAWASVRAATPDPGLRDCYQRLCLRAGKKRAIVAVARRLALRVRARWLAQIKEAA